MSTNTTEAALKACIERHLTGGASYMAAPGNDWNEGSLNGFRSKNIPDKFKEPGYRQAFDESIIRILKLFAQRPPA